jgi:glycosyltransferase involved in cell wall biosynthesis
MHRLNGLKKLLESIYNQTFNSIKKPVIEIIVVDNDPNGSASLIIEHFKGKNEILIKYYIEEKKGIPFARNKSIKHISIDTDFIIFVDDDEVALPNWLEELIKAQERYDADVITGPVEPLFMSPVPEWITKGGFFKKSLYEEGELLKTAATNNTLIKKSVFDEMNRGFSEDFANTGGSDTHFFMDVWKRGYKIRWTTKAIVKEFIPPSRANFKWLIQRAYREGNVFSRCEADLSDLKLVKVLRFCKANIKILIGIVNMPLSLVRGKIFFVKNCRKIAIGIGEIQGLFGKKYDEYKNIHEV